MPQLPVDRHWIQKLLQKHGHTESNTILKSTAAGATKCPAALVLAPMVDQSDLPFRLQSRRYGTNIAFTPMIHAKLFSTNKQYRKRFTLEHTCPEDRPLIAQICGGDVETVVQCALLLEPHCDGIDINCGCPQSIARRGNYGAFLLEQEDTLLTLVKALVSKLSIPLSVKVRLLPDAGTKMGHLPDSLGLYRKLVDAGIHLLTVHGRTRYQKGALTKRSDWDAIRTIVDALGDKIPIFANGSVSNLEDAKECLRVTHADGVMSSEAILEYPGLFADTSSTESKTQAQLALEYMDICKRYPPNEGGQGSGLKCQRAHMHKFLHRYLMEDVPLRQAICRSKKEEELYEIVEKLAEKEYSEDIERNPQRSWYLRYRNDKDSRMAEKQDCEDAKVDRKRTAGGVPVEENEDDCKILRS